MQIDQNYLLKFKQGKEGKFLNALRDIIAKKTHKPFKQIAALTKGWQKEMLEEAASLSEKHPANFWNYYKKTKV